MINYHYSDNFLYQK